MPSSQSAKSDRSTGTEGATPKAKSPATGKRVLAKPVTKTKPAPPARPPSRDARAARAVEEDGGDDFEQEDTSGGEMAAEFQEFLAQKSRLKRLRDAGEHLPC